MKATGIVRRIDDLGRVVVPKKSAAHCGSGKVIHWKFLLTEKRDYFKEIFPHRGTRYFRRTIR